MRDLENMRHLNRRLRWRRMRARWLTRLMGWRFLRLPTFGDMS